jgi:hypothetical protein
MPGRGADRNGDASAYIPCIVMHTALHRPRDRSVCARHPVDTLDRHLRSARRPQRVGCSLNVYSRSTADFDVFDEKLMDLCNAAASQAVTDARRW